MIILLNNITHKGVSFGASKSVVGEFVFNTGMVGYPEALTDPSYRGQILVLTYPLIGNYGVSDSFFESERIQVSGLVASDYAEEYSHWSARQSLGEWLKREGVPAVCGIDTRSLTRTLRAHGTMRGGIFMRNEKENKSILTIGKNDEKKNFVSEVSIRKTMIYEPEQWQHTVLLIDCGVKRSIIRSLMERKCRIIRVPWNVRLEQVNERYDGVVISNGPGDPKMCTATVATVKRLFKKKKPMFGICLGHQIMALAAGADTYKLKYGHRSHNQPCICLKDERCYITTQNHGYAVQNAAIPKDWQPWFVNANDKTNEGMKHREKPFFSVQFHPEAHPGPLDTGFIFDEFVKLL